MNCFVAFAPLPVPRFFVSLGCGSFGSKAESEPTPQEKCSTCEGRGGGYNGEEGTEWECPDCWGGTKPPGGER